MTTPITGSSGIFDINGLGSWQVGGPPVEVLANILCMEQGGDGGFVTVEALELSLSTMNHFAPLPADTNLIYMGDQYIRTNTPWEIVSTAPQGLVDGVWCTGMVKFTPKGDGKLPLARHSPGVWSCKYSFTFWLLCLAMSDHLEPNRANQYAVYRGLRSDGTEQLPSGMGTQTFLTPWSPPK